MIHTNGTVYRYGTQVHCISTCTQYSAAAIYSVTVVLNLVGYSTTSRQTAVVTKFSTRVPVLVQAVPRYRTWYLGRQVPWGCVLRSKSHTELKYGLKTAADAVPGYYLTW